MTGAGSALLVSPILTGGCRQRGDTASARFPTFLRRIRDRFPEKRACRPDREVVLAEAGFYRDRLWTASRLRTERSLLSSTSSPWSNDPLR